MANSDTEIRQLADIIKTLGYNLNITWNNNSCNVVLHNAEVFSTTGFSAKSLLASWLGGFIQGIVATKK